VLAAFPFYFFIQCSQVSNSARAAFEASRDEAEGVRVWVREKPGITHGTMTIGFGLTILLPLILMETNFCVYFSGCTMVRGLDVFLRPSIVLIGSL
jgi:hypothetical protein